MKILVLGTTAGAHLLCQKLIQESDFNIIYHAEGFDSLPPTNQYIPLTVLGEMIHAVPTNVLKFLDTVEVDLIIPVKHHYQMWDQLHQKIKEKNIPVLMPTKELGMLEWSKFTGKQLLTKLEIPTPKYKIMFRKEILEDFFKIKRPFVLKYERDWRFGLQTVIVNDDNYQELFDYLQKEGSVRYQKQHVGNFSNQSFVVEEFVSGSREFSFHALCNATGWKYLGSARDYKKRYENDQGYNTAGMGSYSPVSDVDPIIHTYVDKIINFLNASGTPYVGILYLGIMIVDNIPYVLEINTRAGDPELQSIFSIIKNDLSTLFFAAASNSSIPEIEFTNKSAATIRIVNKTYEISTADKSNKFKNPDLYPIPPNICLGLQRNRRLLNSTITATCDTVDEAAVTLYKFLEKKTMNEFTYRTDIGYLK